MKNSVKVVDDTYRRHVTTEVTSDNLQALQEIVGPKVKVGDILPMKTKEGHIAQDQMEMHITYAGWVLKNAIKRSTRWIRNKGLNQLAPRHVTLAMMAHQQADPVGFRALAEG